MKARAVVVPLKRPVKTALGMFTTGPLVLIDVETDQGVTGRAYIFAYTNLTLKPLMHLIEEIGRELIAKPIAPFDLMGAMDTKFRLLGWQGLVGMCLMPDPITATIDPFFAETTMFDYSIKQTSTNKKL